MSREREKEKENDNYYHTNGFLTKLLIITLIASTIILPLFIVMQNVYGFDVVPTVDPPSVTNSKTLLSGTPIQYRFGDAVTKNVTYSDGSIVPTHTVSVERYNQTTKQWDIVGSVNDHMHKVKVDNTDKEDVSFGMTIRWNPKVIPPTSIETPID